MTEQIPHSPVVEPIEITASTQTTVEAGSTPAYVAIETAIEMLEAEADTTWQTISIAYEASSKETQQKIDQLNSDYVSAIQSAEDKNEERPSLASFLDTMQDIPEDSKTGLLAFEANTAKIEAAEKALEQYVPEKAAAVTKKAAELEASIDYDEVVTQAYTDDETMPFEGTRHSSINLLYDVSAVINIRRLLEKGTPLTYQQLKSIERNLEASAAEYAEKGLILKQGEAVAQAIPLLSNTQIVALESRIKGVCDLRAKYKKHNAMLRRKAQTVLGLTRQILQRDDDVPACPDEIYTRAKIVLNDNLNAAVNRRLTQKLRELPADEFDADAHSEAYAELVEQARATDIAEALKKLEISGSLEDLPFEFSEAELKLYLFTSIPAIALKTVKRVVFRPMTQDEDRQDNTLGFHRWSEELNGSEIVISDVKVREHYQEILELFSDDPDAEQYAQLSAKNKMLDVVTHEFGHELHQVLPVAALKRWEVQRASDPTNVTAYVKSYHDSNHAHRYKEDFADTTAMFINRPEVLKIISSKRFDAMQQIFEEFMPLYPKTIKKLQDERIAVDKTIRMSKGMSDESFRATHLSHETT